MTFDYIQRITVDGQLEVDNIGQCVILGRNDIGEESYLIITTILGITEVIHYGPVVPDLEILPFSVSFNYTRFDYSQQKIEKIIERFLNDPKRGITYAETTTIEAIIDHIDGSIAKILHIRGGQLEDEQYTDNS